MNKIFKVIWSKSKQCYIVVSEMAKNHSGKKKIVVASILAAMAVGSGSITNMVDAAGEVTLAGGNAKTPGSIAIGYGSVSDGTVIHNDGSTTVQPSIAIGVGAKSMGNSSVSVGQGAQVLGYSYSVAVGRGSEANGDYGVSVGYNTRAKLHGIAMGEQARAMKEGATTFGVSSRGYGNGSIAIGWQSLAGANVYDENGNPGVDINQDPEKTISDYNKWGDTAIGIRAVATGGNALALGRSATAKAANAVAIGGGNGSSYTDNTEKTEATAEKAVAIGYKTEASAVSSVALGTSAISGGENGVAIGNDAQAQTANTIAVGSTSRAVNANDSALGNASKATGGGATAIGYTVTTSGNQAFGAGSNTEVSGAGAVGIGYKVKASGNRAISIGNDNGDSNPTVASGEKAIAIGSGANSAGSASIAMGRNVSVDREYTTAIGTNITASKNASASTIIGYNSFTKANQSVNIGSTNETDESARYSTAIGYDVRAKGRNAVAIGSSGESSAKVVAAGEDAIAIGTSAQGNNTSATAIGKQAIASDTNSIAFGTSAKGVGASSTAIGNGATTAKANAIALGTSAQGTGESSVAIGNGAQATDSHAFAAGVGAKATGSSAIAVGNSASAAKANSVAIGTDTTASEKETVAVGLRASANGLRSVSVGIDTESTTADGVSVGYLSKSQALGAVAIGRNAVVTAEKSTAVGYDLSITNSASTNIGYTSTVNANQATSVGARNLVEAGAQYGTALGYFVNISGKNAIGIGSSDDKKNVIASAKDAAAIGTSAQATAASAMALGTNANAALAHSVALGEGSTTTTDDGASKIAYLTNESTNNSGNGVISVGNKRNTSDTGTITRRIVSVAGGTDDFDAVNVKQLKTLESNEWLLRTQNAGDANPTDVAPQTVNNQTKKRVTLKAGDNIAISNSNGVVTLNVTNVVKSVATDNTNALDISNTNGAVKINPKLATSVDAAGEANKLVTAGTVKTALDLKVNKADELHVKPGNYTVQSSGDVSLIQENANSQAQSDKAFTIKDVAKKSVVDTLQSDFNTFKTKAITFTGDDNQGVARTLDTTLTVKGGANYTSTTANTNIRVEKDGTTGLAVKLSDKLTGMKEIAGTGTQDLVIKNGDTKVTVKAPANGDKGTVDFGDAKVVASNLDASIKYRANDEAVAKAKSVKLADGFNFVASNVTDTATEGPKSGLAIKAEDNGKVTFGLDKATRNTIDNAADKNLSNLTQDGKNKVTELAKTAAQDAVKVAAGHNTTVTTDTSTAGVTTYKVNANDTTVAVTGNGLAITGGELGTDKVRKYSLDLSAATKGKLAAVGNLATNVIGGTTIAADGTVTGPTFSITKADGTAENAGTIKEAIEKLDAANKGQNTKISDTAEKVTNLATALGGGAKVENGTFTGPTYNITKADGSGTETASNVGDAISKLDTRITTANGALVTKGLDFTGNDTTDAGKVHRDLGTTLTIKGAENFTRTATETNNIKVVKNGDALDVKLAENLAKMKEISGDGASDLVIKNGDTKVTVKAPTTGDKGTVDFGDAKVVASNLDANISYKAGSEDTKKKVKLQDGFNFTAATDTTVTAEGPKAGLAIKAEDNGKVTFGLDKATREKVDNAADKNLSNLSDDGKNKVKELAKTAAQDAVKVADGINTTVEKDTTTTGVTTYKVNANDTTVAVTGDGLAITGGDLGTDKVRKYSLDLSAATKGKLAAVGNLATNVIGGTTVNADGTVVGPTFSITNAAGTAEDAGTIKEAIEKLDAANKGQNTKISETAEKVTQLGETVTNNYNDLSKKISDGTTNITNTLTTKGLDFTGNDTTDAGKVHRDLGTTLTIKGAENFARAATETNNIKVVKNGDALDVKLAENLANMKEISGDGSSDLVIKNGDTKVTVKAPTNGDKGTVNFGDAKVIAKNLEASIAYKSNKDTAKKTVKLEDGFNFTAAADTAADTDVPKSGLAITTGANGEVTFGLDKATRNTIDNAADKNLSNLSDDGKNKVKELAKGAAQDAVKVADGINTTVEKDTATAGVTTYKVNANDTTVAVTGDGLAITGGDLGTDKVRKYSLDLSDATKGKLKAVDGLSTVIGGTNITADGTVTGPKFNITKADGTTEEATTIKDAIDKLNTTNAGQNTKISETAGKVTTLEGKVDGIVEKGMTFAGDDAAADKVTRKLGETLNIHGQNNITVKKDGTAVDTLNVKLASDLKNITSISSGDGTTGSKVTLGADGVSIANTAAGQGGAAGETKTVTIGKDGINAGGMKITNVAEAKAEGDAANKKYVDDAISNLGNIVSGNATLNFAGNVTKNAQDQATEKVGLSLATGTLHVNGANNEITTTAKGDTITVGLAETVKAQLAKVGDTASNGRDGKDGASGAKGLTGKDGLNDKTLTDKVNALRNGEAGSVVYTDENGARLVKAKDGEYYKATDVDATGNVLNGATKATTVEARVVNPDGTTTGGTTKLSNIADGKVAAGSKDAVNGGQLYTAKSEIGAIIGGTTINENGKITGPTFSITNEAGTAENAGTIKEAIEKLDATNAAQNTKISGNTEKLTKLGKTVTNNYNELSTKITQAGTNVTNALTTKGLNFTGDDTTDAGKVHRDLGETLTLKGGENFTRAAAENNIKVVKNGDALDVKLAKNLANMKEISGDGTSDLVIKNGDTKVTVKAPTNGDTGTVDFGKAKVVAPNLDASISYKAGNGDTKKTVKLQDGFNFTAATDTTTTAEGPKSGLAITTGDNGVVTFGLDKATRSTIDNAADKNLSNLSDDGKNKVKELAKGAAQDAVKVADGINTTVEKDTATAGVTTYKVNANDTTVAVNADTLAISGGDLNATTKVRAYTLDLSNTVKAKLNAINNVGDTASNGRDGVNGASGAKGLTGADGLNDKTLTDKVNALRNGEAGSVVYTDENGARLVKAKDGVYYKATDVDKDGNVLNGATPASTVEARLVNPKGETTVPTKLSNIADGKVAANSKDAVNGGQLNTVKSDLATALGGGAKVENGVFTGPTYNITKDDGSNTTEAVKNVGDAISKLDGRINNANTTLANKGLDFTGNDTTAKVHRNLGETLTIKGAENFTRTATETNNIKVVKTDNDLDVKLAENLGNIKSISNTTGEGKPGSTITLGADGVSIANTAAGQDGAAGETKTVTIGKDGINAGGMKVTNVAKAVADEDAANKKYVDEAISNLDTTIRGNATLNFAGNVTKDAQDKATDKVGLALSTGTLHVNGADNEITTTAKGDTITVGLAQAVKDQLAKVGDTASNGRDGKDGASGAKGLTGADGLNDKTLTDKVNALRNGEAGSVVYTDENGARLVKAKDGVYYKATDVDKDGNVLNGATPASTVEARLVNPKGETTVPTKLSNIADGKVVANSKDAVNGGQLHTAKSEIGAIIGGTTINENGKITGPTFSITNAAGTKDDATTIKDAIEKLDATNAAQNTKINDTAEKVTTLDGKVADIVDKGMVFAGDDATADKVTRKLGETLNIHGQNNITVKKDGTAVDTLNVKLASDLKNITSITNADTDGKPGSKITLDANGVSIANTAAGQDGAAGETKTVTIGKDGINAGGMKITNVAKATENGDAANKEYVDNAINNLNTTVTNNANLRYAGDTNEGAVNGEDHLNLPLATGTLKVAGTADQIKTVANNGTITLSLDEKVANKLNKLGDTASNGRDGANGTSGATGLTGKDGLNDKTLTDKVNALRNGEAGTVVYTDDAGERLVKANDGKYYHKDDLKADGTPKTADENNGTEPKAVDNPQARVVNPNGDAKAPTTLSNIADGKVAANSKEAVNGGQLNTVKSDLATALGGGAKVENGVFTGPTYNITKDDGSNTKEEVKNVGDAISKLDGRINNANTTLANKGLDFTGNDTTAKVHRNLGETLTIKGAENFTRTATETNNIKVVKTGNDLDVKLAENLGNIKSISNTTGEGKPGSTITLGADGVSIANTAAGQDGAAGTTKTVTIGKDGINAGGMKVTNVAKAEADGDAANKAYVDDAIKNLNTTVTNNANLRYAGDTNVGAAGEDHLNLPLATGTLKVAGTADQIKTVANNGTITLSLDEKVTNKLDKLGDTASNGRDGANGLTGKDGLNDKTLTDKVNALRNGEAGSVVYTNQAGDRVVKAKDGKYYKADEVKADGTVKTADENNGKAPEEVTTPQARVVNPNGETTVPTKLSNIADGKVAANSKEAVNGGQLNTVKSDLATALGGGAKVENGTFTGPTYNITEDDGSNTKEEVKNVGDAISKLDGRINNANTTLANKGLDFTGNDTTDAGKVHRNLGETLTIKGAENFTRAATETNNIKVVKTDNDLDVKLAENLGNIKSISNATGEGKPGSTITLGADGVSIANTAAGADGAAGETKTVTIGKDGINAGGMKVTNVAKAEADGDAANKKYVDDAITNLNTTVTNNANLRYAGDTNEGVANGEDHLNLPLATGTLKVAGTADQIKTVANNGTITLSLDEKVANKLNKLGDTASNGRDGANGTSGATGLTGKDGLNDKTLTDKVNALRNGEAGTVVYTDDAGERLVKANDGKYYHKDDLKADGTPKTADENNGTAPKAVDNPQARVVNANGDAKAPTTLSNIADGKVAAGSKDAVNGGQLNTVKSDLATALGGGAKVENGVFTGPTYNITKDDGSNTKEEVKNVGDAISKLDGRINNANTTLANKGLDFTGNDTTDAGKVHRNLGETLTIKGAENFTRTAAEANNIKVVKTDNDLDVKLAENLGNIKEIAGNGKDDLVIKNGDATITLKPKKEAEGTNPATPATVDFGDTKVVASNLDASIKYRANDEEAANAKSVKLADGFNFVASTVTDTATEGPKSGLVIKAEDNGKVTFGLDKATREKVDNAADKNLSNLTDDGKNKVKELAGEAAKASVKVADGINTTVTTDTTTTPGVTTYKVNANDTTVAVNADTLAISGGTPDATTKVRAYTLDLSDTVKAKLNAINNVGDTASNGRDGVNGTSGAQGLTGKDGLNDKTLTDKVNALRNGEAGSVVYTNEAGDRVVKAKDGKYYKADEVKADGTVKTAEENKGKAPEEVKTPQARVVNPNGKTTAPTTLSNIADGKIAADSKEAVNGGQLNTVKSDLATALGGGAKVENGVFTGPTYNITKDDGTGTEATSNVGEAISKLDGRINNANTTLANKGLDFTGNDTTAKVHRNLGETLTIKGADNFTRTDAETNNIKVVKNNNDLDVKLAENLGNIKEIAGNGKDDLVIKNGDATITLKPKKEAEGANPATPATVDFGNTKVVAPNLDASITYRANSAEDADAKTVTLQKGLNFVSGDGTAATAEAAKAGITIAADKDGKVVFGLNEATRNAIDNAADKNLNNLSQEGKDKVADLAKTAAREAVKVAAGNNVTVTPETKDGVTTYTVNGRDTTVKAADKGSVSVTGGTLNANGEREYTVDLTAEAKAELGKISDLNTRLGSAEGKITTLQGDMTKAKDDIAANTKAIEANKEAIATNKNAIADNAKNIAANTKDIDANKQGIAENKEKIGENAKAIAKNADAIKSNTDRIHTVETRVDTVETRVDTAEGKIAANEKAIKDNASAIQSNTKAIGDNTTAIAKNASDITKANKEIESLKGNSATKDLSNLTNTGKDTITKLIDVKGENGITVTPSTNTDSRVKTFTAKLNDTVTFGSGDKKITVDGTTGTVTSKAVAADTVKANTVDAKTVQLGDSTGTNTTVTADGIAVTTKNPDGTTSKVEIKNGTVSGLTNTKWDPAKVVTDADRSVVATQGQVKDVTDTLARGRVFVGDTGTKVTVGLGDTLAIKGGSTKALTDDNIGVVSTEAKDGKPATMTVKLAKDVKMKDGSTSYDYYLPEVKTNPDGSKEIVKNADGSVKYQLGKDGNPIRLVTTTVNGEGITIAPVKGLDKPTVSLTADGLDNGGNQIHNVAAGTANTDAATVGQVRAAAHALNNRVNEAGAHAAALAAMNPLSYDPLKKSQVMAGYGAYKGSNALALGVAHYANEDTLFNVGVSVGNGENMVNAGVTYRFGGEDSMIPERYKGGPISSVYVMQDEITALKAENARKDAENAKKEAENEEMKAQIKMLIERVTMLEAKK